MKNGDRLEYALLGLVIGTALSGSFSIVIVLNGPPDATFSVKYFLLCPIFAAAGWINAESIRDWMNR
ncbi:hypothetical protein [Sulfitobacter sp. 20_GPM-1509m]|uniref:hypothetical protein n=1 Tax=Sulfitobacter sp. 20_GPM-1509m TaxID=1380367 RepID=UPI0012DFBB18|nr:hypothetical protein [Sulfitobacter sp. 20_GPM-1509m]